MNEMKVLLNDEFISRNAALVDIEDRGYQFGDGVYEVIAVYGGMPFKMDEHLARLQRSANEIGMGWERDKQWWAGKLNELCSINKLQDGIIYVQMSRGVAQREHKYPPATVPIQSVAYTKVTNQPVGLRESGVRCILVEDIRWLRCDIKSLNLLGNIMSKQKAVEKQAFEAIFHRGETITEGSSTNVFMVKDSVIYTHPTDSFILNGITRAVVLELCHELGTDVREIPFSVTQLLDADEVFVTSTTTEVMPVIEVDGVRVGNGAPGKVTRAIQEKWVEMMEKREGS